MIASPGVGRIQEEEASPRFVDGIGISNWEDSALVRFSEYLGFSTIGYDDEILDLLRKIQSDQLKDRGKGAAKYFEMQKRIEEVGVHD